jgi:hypothetical protein
MLLIFNSKCCLPELALGEQTNAIKLASAAFTVGTGFAISRRGRGARIVKRRGGNAPLGL